VDAHEHDGANNADAELQAGMNDRHDCGLRPCQPPAGGATSQPATQPPSGGDATQAPASNSSRPMREPHPCGPAPGCDAGLHVAAREHLDADVEAEDADVQVSEGAHAGAHVKDARCAPPCDFHPGPAGADNGTGRPAGRCPPPPCYTPIDHALIARLHERIDANATMQPAGNDDGSTPIVEANLELEADADAQLRAVRESHGCGMPCMPVGVMAGAHEDEHIHADSDATTLDIHARAGAHAMDAMPKPCHAPCPAPRVAVGAHERAGADVSAPDVADAGVQEHAGLRLGAGCRDGPMDPDAPEARAGRRVHALESAQSTLQRRLDRLEETIARLEARLAEDNVTAEESARILDVLARLDARQQDILDRIEHLATDQAGLLQRWGETPPANWTDASESTGSEVGSEPTGSDGGESSDPSDAPANSVPA
jgi:hypothetical protein